MPEQWLLGAGGGIGVASIFSYMMIKFMIKFIQAQQLTIEEHIQENTKVMQALVGSVEANTQAIREFTSYIKKRDTQSGVWNDRVGSNL